LYCTAAQRHPHSFPTRRSSDLWSLSDRVRSSRREWRAMLEPSNNDELPPIPPKRYFTIGEVGELCLVKPHVLRYWEQEFPQLKPDRKSTRLNSSHVKISYAVFC